MNNNETKKTYSIGQVAEITGISPRMLRYYEKKGLIIPVHRSAGNNYRYYSETQLEELLLIKELNRVGFATDELIRIFYKRDLSVLGKELENRIMQANKDIQAAMRKYIHMNELYFRVLKSLQAIEINNMQAALPTIKMTTIPSREYVSYRYFGLFNSRDIFMEKVAVLYKIIKENNLPTLGPLHVIFHNQYKTSFSNIEGDVELYVPLEPGSNYPDAKVSPAYEAISCLQIGPYFQLENTYKAMEKWAKEQDLVLAGTAIEEYIINPTMTAIANNFVTEIYLVLDK